MSRMPLNVSIGALLALAICAPAAAQPQTTAYVRVVNGPARILAWLNGPGDVLRQVDTGTVLAVLDEEERWYWVVVPPDIHGTRKAGWIHARNVEPAGPPAPGPADGRDDTLPLPSEAPPAEPPPPAEDKVTISERRRDAVTSESDAPDKPYAFEDVLFDRDRFTLRQEDMDRLRSVVATLEATPSLVVNLEGHTCNLGSTAYNLALGTRRAEAVKNYLVGEGIAADRLHAVSLGETKPKHDNAREETRRLNRRVAVVPEGQR